MEAPGTPRVYAMLLLAVAVISFSAILIKLADAVPALAIAAWRMALSSAILVPWVAWRGRARLRALWTHRSWVLLSGLVLALHFVTWISSLKFTSVASSVVLVTTNPLFVGLGSYLFLKERLSRALVIGILVSVAGGIVIGVGDFRVSGAALWGDLLAFLGALTASAYFLIGRRLRPRVDLDAYVFAVYTTAALVLLVATPLAGVPLWGFPAEQFVWLLLLALGPQLVGHSTLNWSLRYLSAGAVAVAILGEPIGSALLAWWLLGEPLTLSTILGGGLILTGVYFALRAEMRDK